MRRRRAAGRHACAKVNRLLFRVARLLENLDTFWDGGPAAHSLDQRVECVFMPLQNGVSRHTSPTHALPAQDSTRQVAQNRPHTLRFALHTRWR